MFSISSISLGCPEGISPFLAFMRCADLRSALMSILQDRLESPKFVAAVAGMGNVLDEWF